MAKSLENKNPRRYRYEMLKARFALLQKMKENIAEMAYAKPEDVHLSFMGSAAEMVKFLEGKQAENAIESAKKDLAIIREMLAEIRDELKNLQVEIGLK